MMMSSVGDPSAKIQEDLADVEYLKKLWDGDKGSFFDALAEAKTGVWTYCPAHYRVYVKILYLDRQEKVISCIYTPLGALTPLIHVETSTVKEIEQNGHASVSWSDKVAEVNNNQVNIYTGNDGDKRVLIELIAPLFGITGQDAESLRNRPLGSRYRSSKQLYVFSAFKAGEQPASSVRTLDELSFDVTLGDLLVASREAEIISKGSYLSKKKLDDILEKDWISSSLKVLNVIAFKYKGYKEGSDEYGSLKKIIKKELSENLGISNDQKLNSAFEISASEWFAYRNGIFGDAKDGKISLLDIVNRLAEVDYDARVNCRKRSHYASQSVSTELDDAFNNRVRNSGDFGVWVEKEVKIFKSRGWGALSKHISEFIRN
ncbi:hypothetical protein JHC43_13170 [Marinobacter salarius]|uniref:hypothetical protein n=1 Tax=Marinobacter salarius TaxID=1420917 RepID=UPI0018F14A9E|nr:hypothetical protein [Marinobacter salarius]MBJ7277427.1 hypothetical protein [Marinobacter salarius]